MERMMEYDKLGITIPFGRTSGKVKTKCPQCSATRNNKTDKSLSVNLDDGLFKCHYCGFSGSAKKREFVPMQKEYKKPKWNNQTVLSDNLVKWFERRGISQATIEALKITEGLEFMPQKSKECNTVQFNYFYNEELINVKYRTGDKCFKLVSGAELILWNIDSLRGQKETIITEGEIDAASYFECGFKSVVSVPNGANSTDYLDNYIELFDEIETIYIASDTDRKGIQLKDELVRRFGPEKCKIVSYGKDCKDANEHLIKYGKESLKITIANAEDIKIEGVFSVKDNEDELNFLYENGLQKGYTIGHSVFDKLISFETGRLCVVTGIPSHGKSEFVDEITTMLNVRYGMKFAYFSPENYPSTYLLSKLISKITGKKFGKDTLPYKEYVEAKEYMDNNFFTIYPSDDLSVESVLDKAKYLVKKKGIRGLVLDPWNKFEHQASSGMSETQYTSKQLDTIINTAQKYGILIFLVAHPTKMKKVDGAFEIPTLYDVSGSSHFYNKTDFGLTVYRDMIRNVVKVCVQKVKFKHLGEIGETEFKYNMNNGRYVPYFGQNEIDWYNGNYLRQKEEGSQQSIGFEDKHTAFEKAFMEESNNQVPF